MSKVLSKTISKSITKSITKNIGKNFSKNKIIHHEHLFESKFFQNIDDEISKVFIGQKRILAETLITLLSEGHLLLNGVPGLAKTLMVKAFSQLFSLTYNRTQFTPDLMPADLIGFEILNQKKNEKNLTFQKGPIFCNFFLADEINRSPAKTQSALLESMEEKQVTMMGKCYELPSPFLVLATQNPINERGTYELPEAQLDRFMSMIHIHYPTQEEEVQIAQIDSEQNLSKIKPIFKSEKNYFSLRKEIEDVKVAPEVFQWVVKLVRNTRPSQPEFNGEDPSHVNNFEIVNKYVDVGCSPRATKNLIKAAKTTAYLDHKKYIEKKHIAFIAPMIFRHRIKLRYEAEIDNITSDIITDELLQVTKL